VNDLKLGDSSGGVALWIGPGTEGYFSGLEIKAATAGVVTNDTSNLKQYNDATFIPRNGRADPEGQ